MEFVHLEIDSHLSEYKADTVGKLFYLACACSLDGNYSYLYNNQSQTIEVKAYEKRHFDFLCKYFSVQAKEMAQLRIIDKKLVDLLCMINEDTVGFDNVNLFLLSSYCLKKYPGFYDEQIIKYIHKTISSQNDNRMTQLFVSKLNTEEFIFRIDDTDKLYKLFFVTGKSADLMLTKEDEGFVYLGNQKTILGKAVTKSEFFENVRMIDLRPLNGFRISDVFDSQINIQIGTIVKPIIFEPEYSKSINRLDDYIKFISPLFSKNDRSVFYRGVYFPKSDLTPSVFRAGREEKEERLFLEYKNSEPALFENKTCVQQLTTMQHYFLPTRLLDFTSNPLVALYFACTLSDEDRDAFHKDDGEIFVLLVNSKNIKYVYSEEIRINALLAQMSFEDKLILLGLIKIGVSETAIKTTRSYRSLLSLAKQDGLDEENIHLGYLLHNFFSKGNYLNPRIRAQQGSFVLFGIEDREILLDDTFEGIFRLYIPYKSKAGLLKELNTLGINQYTLYCEKENLGKYISSNVK